jgi:hypothetical protein
LGLGLEMKILHENSVLNARLDLSHSQMQEVRGEMQGMYILIIILY